MEFPKSILVYDDSEVGDHEQALYVITQLAELPNKTPVARYQLVETGHMEKTAKFITK